MRARRWGREAPQKPLPQVAEPEPMGARGDPPSGPRLLLLPLAHQRAPAVTHPESQELMTRSPKHTNQTRAASEQSWHYMWQR